MNIKTVSIGTGSGLALVTNRKPSIEKHLDGSVTLTVTTDLSNIPFNVGLTAEDIEAINAAVKDIAK